MGDVRGHEPLNLLGRDGGICRIRSLMALAAEDGKPYLDKLSQDACTGKKWNTNVRCGWEFNQFATAADRWELTGSRISWMGMPAGVCSSSKASSSQTSRERCLSPTDLSALQTLPFRGGRVVDV